MDTPGRRLSELVRDMVAAEVTGEGDPLVTAVEYDSRRVKPGSLFVAIPGLKMDGGRFVREAVGRGATAIVSPHPLLEPTSVLVVRVPDARKALAESAWALHDHPERVLTSVAVTGTNGKTTTASILRHVLQKSGNKTGLIGTLGVFYDQIEQETTRTTPESSELAQHFATMRDRNYTHVVMEATSIGIDLERVWKIPFRTAIFTNLTRDHLDYHGSEEAYRSAKLRLFSELAPSCTAVINADDPAAPIFAGASHGRVLTYSIERASEFRAHDIKLERDSLLFELEYPDGRTSIQAPLIGRFNVYNLLSVIASAWDLGIQVESTAQCLHNVEPVRGRAEVVPLGAPFTAIVDYAHTPDALEKILSTLRAMQPHRIITVVGAGGDRDRGKRPLMANVSGRLSDIVILTSDNPRGENPEAILKDMELGLESGTEYRRETNRRKAIAVALSEAREGDIILVAGKGHETYQEIHGTKYPFDDRQVIIEEYKRIASGRD